MVGFPAFGKFFKFVQEKNVQRKEVCDDNFESRNDEGR